MNKEHPLCACCNNFLEIDEILKKTPSSAPQLATERVYKCSKHNRSLEFYCETESHQQHQYDEFAKYKQVITSCLGPVNKKNSRSHPGWQALEAIFNSRKLLAEMFLVHSAEWAITSSLTYSSCINSVCICPRF